MASEANGFHRVFQDGTRYHLPTDTPEHERLDAQSASLVALMNHRPFQAPLSHPKRILDVGCGTGTMTHVLGTLYPNAEVIGIDLAPVPESRHGKLPNVRYVQGDIRDMIARADPRFQPASFDYIFERLLIFGITEWTAFIDSLTGLLRPGGWLECQEVDMQLWSPNNEQAGDGMVWYQKFKEDTSAIGLDVEVGPALRSTLEATGAMENLQQQVFPFPPKMEPGFEAMSGLIDQIPMLFTVVTTKVCSGRRGEEEVQSIVRDMRDRWDKGFGMGHHFDFYTVTGQKL